MMANSGGLDFLDDFLGLFDTECEQRQRPTPVRTGAPPLVEVDAAPPLGPFLLAIVVCSFSFLGLTISSLILTVSFVPTHWSMKVIWTCSLLALAPRQQPPPLASQPPRTHSPAPN